jgi:predicted ATPase
MNPMILKIRRFKRFNTLALTLRDLTVLTGRNSAGKSTAIQALRLAREAAISGRDSDIWLNEDGLLLGTFDDIYCNSSESQEYSIEIEIGRGAEPNCVAVFSPANDEDECESIRTQINGPISFDSLSPWSFIFLSAERQGPRLRQSEICGGKVKDGLGVQGQFTAQVLAQNQTLRIEQSLVHPSLSVDGQVNALLTSNLERWMQTIVGPIGIKATRPPRLGSPILELKSAGKNADWQFPTNHGFGVSYALPIVLAGLLLEPSGVLIIDSPEAHLHPAAQTAMAFFLSHIAATGRKVIVETHSDHVVDGFRLAIANPIDSELRAENCVFHYFDTNQEDGSPQHHAIEPRTDGSLPKWPAGFFDQTSANLRALGRIVRDRKNA